MEELQRSGPDALLLTSVGWASRPVTVLSPGQLETGVHALDGILGDVTVAEFFGEWGLTLSLAHRVIARNGGDVVLTQNFGGLDTYRLERLRRRLGGPEPRFVRAFSLASTMEALKRCSESSSRIATVIDPYLYAPERWEDYSALSAVTAELRRVAQQKVVAIFNRSSHRSRGMPEGGSFHAHSIPTIVHVEAGGEYVTATLLKHPSSGGARVRFHERELDGVRDQWAGQHRLSEWL